METLLFVALFMTGIIAAYRLLKISKYLRSKKRMTGEYYHDYKIILENIRRQKRVDALAPLLKDIEKFKTKHSGHVYINESAKELTLEIIGRSEFLLEQIKKSRVVFC